MFTTKGSQVMILQSMRMLKEAVTVRLTLLLPAFAPVLLFIRVISDRTLV